MDLRGAYLKFRVLAEVGYCLVIQAMPIWAAWWNSK